MEENGGEGENYFKSYLFNLIQFFGRGIERGAKSLGSPRALGKFGEERENEFKV